MLNCTVPDQWELLISDTCSRCMYIMYIYKKTYICFPTMDIYACTTWTYVFQQWIFRGSSYTWTLHCQCLQNQTRFHFQQLLLELLALVDQKCGITPVIHKQITSILTWHSHHLLSAPPVLRYSLALPCEDCVCACLCNSCCSMVLCAEYVAWTPAHFCTHDSHSLNQHTCLDGHVDRAIDVDALERLSCASILAFKMCATCDSSPILPFHAQPKSAPCGWTWQYP